MKREAFFPTLEVEPFEAIYGEEWESEKRIKQTVSQWLDLDFTRLHDLEMEDIEIAPYAEEEISTTLSKMTILPKGASPPKSPYQGSLLKFPCKGYWVEDTKELVIYLWGEGHSKAFIVPKEAWCVKKCFTIH